MKTQMVRSILFISFLFVLIASCSKKNTASIETPPTDKYDIVINSSIVEVDNLGRIYVVNKKNSIINYKPTLEEQYKYANKRAGAITSIDVTNPLKIVAFVDDFNSIKVLDNTLSIIDEISFADKFADISACSVTNDGNYWVYDPTQYKLLKVNDKGIVLLETSNVNDFGMVNVQISSIKEKANKVLLVDKNKGFYIFDNLGQFIFHYEVKDIKSFQFDGSTIYYYTGTGLKRYNLQTQQRAIIGTPFDCKEKDLLYVLYLNGNFVQVKEHGINLFKQEAE